jgi:hypothetical protein
LALVLKTVNQEKHGHTAKWYWQLLEKRFGSEWLRERRQFAKVVDVRRRGIDKRRRVAVAKQMTAMTAQLQATFPGHHIDYVLVDDHPVLWVDEVNVEFPRGFIRERKAFDSFEFLAGIVPTVTRPRT